MEAEKTGTSPQDQHTLLQFGSADTDLRVTATGTNTFRVGYYDGDTGWTSAEYVLPSSAVGKWVHVAGTYEEINGSDAVVSLYLNGKYRLQTTKRHSTLPTSGDLTFGEWVGLGRNALGTLDEVAVFDRVLTATEIQRLYTGNLALWKEDNTLRFSVGDGVLSGDVSAWTPGEWHHVAGVYDDAGNATLYLDDTVATSGSYAASSLGSVSYVGEHLDGRLDDLLVFSVTPSTSAISKLYATSGKITVDTPTVTMSPVQFAFHETTTSGTLGGAEEMILVSNGTETSNWTVSMAAANNTDLWQGMTYTLDYNDPLGARLTLNPAVGTIERLSGGMGTDGLISGVSQTFEQDSVDSITLFSSNGADTQALFSLSEVELIQTVPEETEVDVYNLNLIITIS
jgi:hypothetical protein